MAVTIKQFNARVGQLTKSNTKFKNEVQELLVIAAQFAFGTDKNVSPLTNLVIKDGEFRFDGVDNAVLIRWIEEHMPARWIGKDSKFVYNKSFQGDYDAVTLLAEPWWKKQLKPRQVASTIDALAEVREFIKRLEKKAGSKVVVDGVETVVELQHAELVAKVKALLNDAEYAQEA